MLHLTRTLVKQIWCLLLGLLCLTVACSTAGAQTADTFTVRNIAVDVSAENVKVARDRAFASGQQQAFQVLLQRLTAQADWPRLPKMADKELPDLVLDVGVDQEKQSTVRYLATLSVRFKPDAIRRVLRTAGIAYVEWRGRPVVVLPVWQSDNGPVLGETPTPWRDAWKSGAAQGVVPLVVPNPEQTEGTVNGAQAVTGAPEVLAAVGARFNTQDVLIAVATPQRQDGGKLKVDVALTGIGPVGGSVSGTRSYTGEAMEADDAVLRRAVEDIAKSVNEAYKSGGHLLQFDHAASLAVTVPLNGTIADWTAVREGLIRSTPVRSFEVAALSQHEAVLVLHYVGDQQQLETVFAQNGMALTSVDDHWVLRSTGAAVRPATGPAAAPKAGGLASP
jgi:hypothetical protein